MTTITFTVPGVPVAQPRQRHALIAGHLRNYTPSRHPVNTFKAACQLAARQAYDGPPLTGPLVCELVFVLPRPRSVPKRTGGRLAHCKKPDVENLAKSVLDALAGILYDDDRRIWKLLVEKWVAAVDEQPQVVVTLEILAKLPSHSRPPSGGTTIMTTAARNVTKLPAWAQELLADLQCARDLAVRELNEYCDSQTPSAFYTEHLVCTGEEQGPSVKRNYIQSRTMCIDCGGLDVRIICLEDGIQISWNSQQRYIDPRGVGVVPTGYQQISIRQP